MQSPIAFDPDPWHNCIRFEVADVTKSQSEPRLKTSLAVGRSQMTGKRKDYMIETKQNKVTYQVTKDSPEIESPYTEASFSSVENMLSWLANPASVEGNDFLQITEKNPASSLILKALNQGIDQRARASVRARLVRQSEGPEKAIEKQVKALMDARSAAGKPISYEIAKAKIELLNAED